MEYLDKNDLQGIVQTTFHCSSKVACFDVSPKSDYIVCECRNGTIQLWSLYTGHLKWKRRVDQVKRYSPYCGAMRISEPFLSSPYFYVSQWSGLFSLSCFRSVVFHPTKNATLPRVLNHAYNFYGDRNRPFPECKSVSLFVPFLVTRYSLTVQVFRNALSFGVWRMVQR